MFNPSIDAADVAASANDGVVTRSGEVDSLPERHAAKRAALRLHGVKTVTDTIVVRNPGTATTKDTDFGEAAGQMLGLTVDVPPNTVKADVREPGIARANRSTELTSSAPDGHWRVDMTGRSLASGTVAALPRRRVVVTESRSHDDMGQPPASPSCLIW